MISVLIVEDDADIREALCEVLTDNGYNCATARNGREGLEMLKQGGFTPQLILLDIMMPEMDGWEFRDEQLKDPVLNTIPVIVLTADASARQRAKSLGTGYLRKPVDFEELDATLRATAAAEG